MVAPSMWVAIFILYLQQNETNHLYQAIKTNILI